ncbi:MAG: MipA/OmpV family protein [Gammaproteobacteria bacterium]|nr:MipA/OmpV family protein [Gammaproteobacteria bacterium]
MGKIYIHLRFPVLVSLLLGAFGLYAEPLPKWELGAGLGGIALADYRGSKETSSITLPFPYFEYRGAFLKADREDGMRGQLLASDYFELNISGDFSPTIDTDNNRLREGMPSLDPTFELGTTLDINVSGTGLSDGWFVRLPVRAVYTFNSNGIEHIGWLTHPQLAYRNHHNHWNIRAYTGPILADHAYHNYYYSVAPEYARSGRETYQAGSGYSGLASGLSITRRWGRFWAGAFVRYDTLAGAVFEMSPLVETRHYFSVGIGTGWVFASGHNAKP